MKFSNMLSTAGEWLRGEGPHHQIVISSRVRLARNLRNRPFPGWAKKAERSSILELIRSRVAALPEMQEAFAESLQDLSALDRQVLVERHLISREHAAKGAGSAVVVNRRQTLSIMINEEDHLRMQSIRSGLQLKQAFKLVDKIDSALEGKLDFAFDPRLGYLTACPTNVGTGMRASAMLHLPGQVEHRGGAHTGADVRGARGQVSQPRIESEVQFAFKRAVDFVHELKCLFQLQAGANRLHPQMIFFVDHDAQCLPPIHHHRAARALGGMLATDQVALHENLPVQRRKIL